MGKCLGNTHIWWSNHIKSTVEWLDPYLAALRHPLQEEKLHALEKDLRRMSSLSCDGSVWNISQESESVSNFWPTCKKTNHPGIYRCIIIIIVNNVKYSLQCSLIMNKFSRFQFNFGSGLRCRPSSRPVTGVTGRPHRPSLRSSQRDRTWMYQRARKRHWGDPKIIRWLVIIKTSSNAH